MSSTTRGLSLGAYVALVVGNMIGSGVFLLPASLTALDVSFQQVVLLIQAGSGPMPRPSRTHPVMIGIVLGLTGISVYALIN